MYIYTHNTSICVLYIASDCHLLGVGVFDSFVCVTCRIYICDRMHSYVWHDALMCVTWHIPMCHMTVHHNPTRGRGGVYFQCVMSHVWLRFAWHGTFLCVTWLIQIDHHLHLLCWIIRIYVWIYIWAGIHTYVWIYICVCECIYVRICKQTDVSNMHVW